MIMPRKSEKLLLKAWTDPSHPGAFGGVMKLYRALRTRKIKLEQVKRWIQGQRAWSLQKQPRWKFLRNRVIAYDANELWQADLVEMNQFAMFNDNFKYILTIIDVLTKKAYAVPLKTKTEQEVMAAFEKVLNTIKSSPKHIMSDKGMEFMGSKIQKFFRDRGIKHYVSQNDDIKAQVVERFNRTLKGLMYRYFTYRNTHRFIDVLDKLLANYNKSYHRSIKMTPLQASMRPAEAFENLYPEAPHSLLKAPSNLKVGDFVRLVFKRDKFRRGYNQQWTEEVFKITEIKPSSKLRAFRVYKVEDLNGEAIQGTFYAQELQKVTKPDLFVVERVIKTRKRRGHRKEYYVSWRGYGPEFNSWVTNVHQNG
jgi:transposase InsO family protein